MSQESTNRSGNPNPSPDHQWKKGQSGNPSGLTKDGRALGGRPKVSDEEKSARKRLRQLVASRADVPITRMYAMLDRHDKAVADGLRGAANGVLNPDQLMKVLTYLNDWGNTKGILTLPDEDSNAGQSASGISFNIRPVPRGEEVPE